MSNLIAAPDHSEELGLYQPYGEEWEKEMMKYTKKELIQFIRTLNQRTEEAI